MLERSSRLAPGVHLARHVIRGASILGFALLAACAPGAGPTPVHVVVPSPIDEPRAQGQASLQAPPPVSTRSDSSAAQPQASESPAPAASSASFSAVQPTWSQIYARYFAPGTSGGCSRSAACHRAQMGDAASAYVFLQQRGYIDGTRSALVQSNSCLHWFGGNMPPRAKDDPSAAADLNAWVAAGAAEN